MTKNINTAIKIILIFIITIFISWLSYSVFSDVYIHIANPQFESPGLFLALPDLAIMINGFFIAYSFFGSLLSFLLIEEKKKQWLGWFIIMLPLLVLNIGVWDMYLWYAVATAIGYVVGRGVRALV